jgi:hypothetical protein
VRRAIAELEELSRSVKVLGIYPAANPAARLAR